MGGAGDSAGEEEEGGDAVARSRRDKMSASNVSSNGRENSSRKNGWADRFWDGEGELINGGVEVLEPGES